MSKATYPLKSLLYWAGCPAAGKGRWCVVKPVIAAAVAEKVGAVETAAEFFKKRAGKATGEGLMKFLRTAPRAGR